MKRKNVRANLLNEKRRIVRRVYVPEGTTFLLNLHDGRYYDLLPKTRASFVVRPLAGVR